jgi:hypothetical protein
MRKIPIILLFFLSAKNLYACKCGLPYTTTIENIQKANYVSLVRVKNILSTGNLESHKIIIEEINLYKGNSITEIIVSGGNKRIDPTFRTSCDMGIDINEEWLIYGFGSDGKITTGYCSQSFSFSYGEVTNPDIATMASLSLC